MPERAARLLFLTGGVRGLHCLRALLDAEEPVVAVLGQPGSESDEVARLARRAALPYLAPDGPNRRDVLERVAGLAPSLGIMAGYNRILRRPLLEQFPEGVVNLHGGPLPEYRGASPLNWQILRGETEIGISALFTDEGVDTGPVLASDRFALAPDEAIDSVVERSLPRFVSMLAKVLAGLRSGTLAPVPQDESRARTFAKRLPRDGWIDWRLLGERQVHDLVRALSGSYPGAFAFHRGRRVVLETTRRLAQNVVVPPGRVHARRDDGVVVGCADRAVLVTRARDDSGRVVPAAQVLPPRLATFDPCPGALE